MDFLISSLICFGVSFILVFLFYLIYFNRKKIKNGDYKKLTEVNYLVRKFDLNMQKIKYKKLLWIINFTNAFIISFTFTIIVIIKGFVWGLLVGFVILMILIYSLYEIIGRVLKKRSEINE